MNIIGFNIRVVFDFNIYCFQLVACNCTIAEIANHALINDREDLKKTNTKLNKTKQKKILFCYRGGGRDFFLDL